MMAMDDAIRQPRENVVAPAAPVIAGRLAAAIAQMAETVNVPRMVAPANAPRLVDADAPTVEAVIAPRMVALAIVPRLADAIAKLVDMAAPRWDTAVAPKPKDIITPKPRCLSRPGNVAAARKPKNPPLTSDRPRSNTRIT